jgi:hypothetical protein
MGYTRDETDKSRQQKERTWTKYKKKALTLDSSNISGKCKA